MQPSRQCSLSHDADADADADAVRERRLDDDDENDNDDEDDDDEYKKLHGSSMRRMNGSLDATWPPLLLMLLLLLFDSLSLRCRLVVLALERTCDIDEFANCAPE